MLVQRLAPLGGFALQLGLDPAQVEEQRLLAGGGPGAHHRPVAHHIVLDRGLDPPHGISRKPHAPIGVELVGRLHQAQARLLDQVVHRRAVAAELRCHADRQPHVGRDQPVQRAFIPLVAPSPRQPQFGFRVQQFGPHRLPRHRLVRISVKCHDDLQIG